MTDAPDEGRERLALSRANRAKQLLEDDLLKEAFESVNAALNDAWAVSTIAQTDEREKLWLMIKLLARVRSHLEAVMQGGKLATARLTEIERKRSFDKGSGQTVARARRMGVT